MFIKLIERITNFFPKKNDSVIPLLSASDWFDHGLDEVEEVIKSNHLKKTSGDFLKLKGVVEHAELEILIAHHYLTEFKNLDRAPYIKEQADKLKDGERPFRTTKEWLYGDLNELWSAMRLEFPYWGMKTEMQVHLITSSELKQLASAYNIVTRVEEELTDLYAKKVELTRAELGLPNI